jgi:hypothetical protein
VVSERCELDCGSIKKDLGFQSGFQISVVRTLLIAEQHRSCPLGTNGNPGLPCADNVLEWLYRLCMEYVGLLQAKQLAKELLVVGRAVMR